MDAKTAATQIVNTLKNHGYAAYFAGGWVRDLVMGHPSDDIDIATSAPPEEIVKIFRRTIPVGIAFGVIVVIIKNWQFEVSTFRKDVDYHDGRRPDHIELSNPEEDAKRRDFTINGMFYDPLSGEIIDYVGAQVDIKKKLIRTIGEPRARFEEDRLRMIRAVRFACRFDFAIDESTQQAIVELADKLLPAVSIERIWQELKKMADGGYFNLAILWMSRLGLLTVIFPQLKAAPADEIARRAAVCARFPVKCPAILFIAELLEGSGLEKILEVCDYLKVTNRDKEIVESLFHCMKLIDEKGDDYSWAKYCADPRSQNCINVIAVRYPDSKRQDILNMASEKKSKLQSHIDRIIAKTPLVTSEILMQEGITPGKLMGVLLKEAEKIAINQNLHDSHSVLNALKQSSFWRIE